MKRSISKLAFGLLIGSMTTFVYADSPAIGSKAPDFSLTDINGKPVALADFKGKTVVLEWTNPGCPFVRKHYDSGNMQQLQKKWADKGVTWLSICSSAAGKEGSLSAAEWSKQIADDKSSAAATLLDGDGKVGKAYGAKTTPHMFVINGEGNLVYKGAIDDKPTYKSSDIKGSKNYVDAALAETMAGKKVTVASTEAYGCSVKYAK